jgi:CheY-like chemotaxis protein
MNHPKQILIVDDDADDREMIKDAFTSSDNQNYIFLENGDKLLEYLEQNAGNGLPALILLDLNMPGKDGRKTLKEIKSNKRYAPIPTIVFTTSSAPKDRNMAYELGANCFVTKPNSFNKLVELIHSISSLWL